MLPLPSIVSARLKASRGRRARKTAAASSRSRVIGTSTVRYPRARRADLTASAWTRTSLSSADADAATRPCTIATGARLMREKAPRPSRERRVSFGIRVAEMQPLVVAQHQVVAVPPDKVLREEGDLSAPPGGVDH